MLGGATDESRFFPIIYFLVVRIAAFIYNTPFIQFFINLPKKILSLFKPIMDIFSKLSKPFGIFKKQLEPIIKPFQKIWQIVKYIIFAPYFIIKFFYTHFKPFVLDLWEIIKMGHNLLEMYTFTNAILYTFSIYPYSESTTKRFIYLGTMLISLIVIGYNKYNDIIINPIFSLIEKIFFGKTTFSNKNNLNQTNKPKTLSEFFNKYMFAIFPITITLKLMKMIDCGVVPGKDNIPYIPIPIPFIGIILTPLFNMIIRMGDIEFFYGYVGIRFLIYFMFQLPVKLMLSSDKVTESIKKLGPVPRQILQVVKVIYYILNPIGFIISKTVNKNNYKMLGGISSSILSIVSMVILGLYFKGHSSVSFLSKIENKLCDGVDMFNNAEDFIENNIIDNNQEYYNDQEYYDNY